MKNHSDAVDTLRINKIVPNGRVLLSSFAASIGLMYCVVRSRILLFYHGSSGEGRLAMRTTAQRFSRHIRTSTIAAPQTKLWLLFIQMAVYKPFDMRIVCSWAYAMFLCEFILTAATALFTQFRTGFFDVYCMCMIS